MTRTLCGALVAISLLGAGETNADTGFYFGASYGLGEVDGTADTGGGPILSGTEIQEIPLDGAPFDDDDSAWSGYLGFQANDYVALEAGYSDLGAYQSSALGLNGAEAPELDVDGVFLIVRLRYPLTSTISATWHAGIVEASFEVDGEARIVTLGGIFQPVEIRNVPFADVDDETGYRWGFGADWRFAERVSAGLEFSRQQLKVFDVDTFSLRLTAHL